MALSSDSKSLLDLSSLQHAKEKKIALLATEWNDHIVRLQIEGAEAIATRTGAVISKKLFVPGSFELPFAAKKLWETLAETPDRPDALILFGAVVRGGTPHFEYVSKAITDGALSLNLLLPIPVIFGVLTLDNEDQAWERLGGTHGHKGEEAMITALKMLELDYQ